MVENVENMIKYCSKMKLRELIRKVLWLYSESCGGGTVLIKLCCKQGCVYLGFPNAEIFFIPIANIGFRTRWKASVGKLYSIVYTIYRVEVLWVKRTLACVRLTIWD
jgi:hypothetical protein